MADLSPDKIIEPISEEQPCGPDLDMEDMDYQNFMAEILGHIPERYFSFDPSSVDFNDVYEKIDGFLDKSHDIRLTVLLAKMRILNGQIDGFIDSLVATEALLKAHWADVHPAGDMDFMRPVELATLDDMPTSILPLQHATLFRSRRAGPITLRKWQLANGDVSPRDDEEVVDGGTIMSEIANADADEMTAIITKMERGRDAVNGIRTICISEGDFESAPTYEKLPEAFEAIIELIRKGTGTEESAGEGEGDADGDDAGGSGAASAGVTVQIPTGDVATREDAIDALFAAEKYYALYEPSSPNVLLLREARNAANKTFAELVGELLPSASSYAFFSFGKEPWFEVPLRDIDSRNPAPDYEGDGEAESSSSSWEDAGLDDGPTSNDEPDDGGGWTSNNYGGSANDEPEAEAAEDSGDDGWTTSNYGGDAVEESAEAADPSDEETTEEAADAEGSADEPASEEAPADEPEVAAADESEPEPEPEPGPEPEPEPEPEESEAKPKFVATNRAEALALVAKVNAYYRVAEPSSPVILMLDRVTDLATKNFIGVLRDVLPDGHLKVRGTPEDREAGGGWS